MNKINVVAFFHYSREILHFQKQNMNAVNWFSYLSHVIGRTNYTKMSNSRYYIVNGKYNLIIDWISDTLSS